MRKDIHPKDYRLVVFKDMSNDYAFITRSTDKQLKILLSGKMVKSTHVGKT